MRLPHVLGLVAGIAIAVLTIAAGHPGDGPPPGPPQPTSGGPSHTGAAGDGSTVSLERRGNRWRWTVLSPPVSRCSPAHRRMDSVESHAWGTADVHGRFRVDRQHTRRTTVDGAPASARSRVRVAAHRVAGDRIRGTFGRTDVFTAPGVAAFTCDRSARFEIAPRREQSAKTGPPRPHAVRSAP